MSKLRQETRRRFLQGVATAGAAGVLLPSTRRALGYQSPNDQIHRHEMFRLLVRDDAGDAGLLAGAGGAG